jgi:hypothetical protein
MRSRVSIANLFRAEFGDYAIVRQKIFERINVMEAVILDCRRARSGGMFDQYSERARVGGVTDR